MAPKCPFQPGADCPTVNCALCVLVNPSTQKYQCAIVDTAWSLKAIAKDIEYIKIHGLPKKQSS